MFNQTYVKPVIEETGILKLADRGTKTINPFNSTNKISSSVEASSVNDKGEKVDEGATQGQTTRFLNQNTI